MTDHIHISYLDEAQVDGAWALVQNVFNECVAPDYSSEGVKTYYELITRDYVLNWKAQNRLCLVAVHDNKVVGIIDLRDGNHITMFFVHCVYQKHGIGRDLLKRAIQEVSSRYKDVNRIEVNSSPFAVGVYSKLGFRQIESEKTFNGIRFTPMELDLNMAGAKKNNSGM